MYIIMVCTTVIYIPPVEIGERSRICVCPILGNYRHCETCWELCCKKFKIGDRVGWGTWRIVVENLKPEDRGLKIVALMEQSGPTA